MRQEDILRLLREQPFQPFRLILSNGTSYEVRHPELAWVSRSTVWLGVPAARLPPPAVADYHLISLLHIVEIEPVPTSRRGRRESR